MSSLTRQRPVRHAPAGTGQEAVVPPTAVPAQRTVERVVVTAPPPSTRWDDYRNAGPDVYWPPEHGEALVS